MRNPKIKEMFDSILPNLKEKEKMFSNITNRKSRKNLLKYILILSMACFSIIINNNTNNNSKISITRNLSVYYNNTNYCEYQEYKGPKDNLIKVDENLFPGGITYKIKNSDSIVIYIDNYKEFRKCEGEIK